MIGEKWPHRPKNQFCSLRKKVFFLSITLLHKSNKQMNFKYTKIQAKWSNQKFWLWHFPYFPPSLLVGPPAEGHTEAGGGRLTPAGLNQTSAGPYSCIYYKYNKNLCWITFDIIITIFYSHFKAQSLRTGKKNLDFETKKVIWELSDFILVTYLLLFP